MLLLKTIITQHTDISLKNRKTVIMKNIKVFWICEEDINHKYRNIEKWKTNVISISI